MARSHGLREREREREKERERERECVCVSVYTEHRKIEKKKENIDFIVCNL